jgi:hypothetical protein
VLLVLLDFSAYERFGTANLVSSSILAREPPVRLRVDSLYFSKWGK